jgi:methyltransferase-like protein/2-polyprenyl-3-methyl-5-hydroxy-6-metoxy-1,4-benzoquinol methylase
MSTETATSYDELPYSDHCFPYSQPDHMAAVAVLRGMEPPPVASARVLELGCGRGGNLIPLALGLPGGRFLGIDLSGRQIAEGQTTARELGLDNLELRAMSIAELGPEFGVFDYIICHGVYSWVPRPIRDKILEICSANLAPRGIAYVSYNTYPGWHERGLVRELLAYHVGNTPQALDRVQRARGFLEDLVRVLPVKTTPYARIIRSEGEFLRGVSNTYMYHEHLEDVNYPLYFHEFMAEAGARGLGFVGEARTPGLIDNLPLDARAALDRWAEDDLAREQYLDFLNNRTFRRTLLSQAEALRGCTPRTQLTDRMTISTGVKPVSEHPDVISDAPEQFRRPEGIENLTTNNPLIKAALVTLFEADCRALSFDELWEAIRKRLGDRLSDIAGDTEARENLSAALLRCFGTGLLDFHVHPPRFASGAGQKPIASPLARLQLDREQAVTNLRGRGVELDEFHRLVLKRLDGTRDRAALLQELRALFESGEFTIEQSGRAVRDPTVLEGLIRSELEPTLRRLAGLALLMA